MNRYIVLPKTNSSNFRRALAAIRPYRKSGIRVERQTIRHLNKQKSIFHNYGHGGAGITLSPATAWEIGQLVDKQKEMDKKVGILGSGIVGLTTALELRKRGYEVEIYSEIIPKKQQKQNQKLITSQVAVGEWFPYFCNFQNMEQQIKRSQKSHQIYKQWIKKYKGISECNAYEEENQKEFEKMVPKELGIKFNKVRAFFSPNSNKYKQLIEFNTFKINLMHFLQELLEECSEKGVIFTNRKINSKQEVFQIKQNLIVNCLGFSSKKIFSDPEVYGLKGHVLQFSNETGAKDIICLKYKESCVEFYCHHDKVLVGLTTQKVEDNKINEKTVKKMFQDLENFRKQYQTATPKL